MSDKPQGQHEEVGAAIGALVDKKNRAYGSAFAKVAQVLRIMYPDGIKPEQYEDGTVQVRTLDKQFRIAHKKYAFGENPWEDIAGYGILRCRDKNTEGGKKE